MYITEILLWKKKHFFNCIREWKGGNSEHILRQTFSGYGTDWMYENAFQR